MGMTLFDRYFLAGGFVHKFFTQYMRWWTNSSALLHHNYNYNLDWVGYIVPGWWVMNISNQFQVLQLAHTISVALVGDHLNGSCWKLYFLYSLSFPTTVLNLNIVISRPYQTLKITQTTSIACCCTVVKISHSQPPFGCSTKTPVNHGISTTFTSTGFLTGSVWGVLQLHPLRPSCPTSSCRTVSMNSWVKPVVMPAMRCYGRFRSLGEDGVPGLRCFLVLLVHVCLIRLSIYTCSSWINTVWCELMDIVTRVAVNGKD